MPSVATREAYHKLTDDYLGLTLELARQRGPGRYTLKEIYGEQWQFVRQRTSLGKLIKQAVLSGGLPGVRWVGRKSNKSLLYEVFV